MYIRYNLSKTSGAKQAVSSDRKMCGLTMNSLKLIFVVCFFQFFQLSVERVV